MSQLQDEIAALKMALELEKQQQQQQQDQSSQLPSLHNKSLFASHIELKRENHALRHQIEEMKEAQKRYIGSVKRQSVTFPSTGKR